jgi:CBS domain-containing protein
MSLSKHEYKIADLTIDDEYGIINPEATVIEAAKKMKELGVPDLVVLDEKSNKILGVIGDFDIVQNIVAEGKDPAKTSAKQAMFVIEPVTLETSVVEAFAIMQKLNANVVPVVDDNGKLIGVASTFDVWSYIPDDTVDDVGLIAIKNPKNAEFWFASACALLAFLFAIIFPISGIIGYFQVAANDLAELMGVVQIRGGEVEFYLLQGHNQDGFFVSLFDIMGKGGFWWVILALFSVVLVILGFISLFSLVYASYSDFQKIKTGNFIRVIAPFLFIGGLILEWVLYLLAFKAGNVAIPIQIDGVGLALNIISIGLILLAIYRDQIFKQSAVETNKEEN